MFHTCGPGCIHDPGVRRQRTSKSKTIDFHCHLLTPSVEAIVAEFPQKHDEQLAQRLAAGESSRGHNEKVMGPPAFRRMTCIDERLRDMDAMGVDIQVVSPSPMQYYYWADEALADSICELQNENIFKHCCEHPDRLIGLGAVAPQHPKLAAEQLRIAIDRYKFKGVEVSTMIAGLELCDAQFDTFWAAAEELDCVVFVHPYGTTMGERLNTHYLSNIVGQPLETTIALSKLILGGTFDRFPRLKIVAAHGGGYLPAYLGRTRHGSMVRPEAGAMAKSPVDYLRKIWFDSLVYEPAALRRLIDVVGVSQVIIGTDYPFDMGNYDVHALLDSTPGLTDGDRDRILGLNAAELIGLTV